MEISLYDPSRFIKLIQFGLAEVDGMGITRHSGSMLSRKSPEFPVVNINTEAEDPIGRVIVSNILGAVILISLKRSRRFVPEDLLAVS